VTETADLTIAALAPTPVPPGTNAQKVVDQITEAAKSSFALGMRLSARPRRQGMHAVYAFCRVVDDIADGDLPVADKQALLADWRAEIDRLYAGRPVSAIGQALQRPVADYALPKCEFFAMIKGMEIDANGPVVAPTLERLTFYNRCVAGSVGILSMRIFGAWIGPPSRRLALALANALQLTNILRDVEEDASIGRIYLPAEVLAEAGIPADPATIARHPALPEARAKIGALARRSFAEARAEMPAHDRMRMIPVLAMYGIYHAYLKRMERAGWRWHGRLKMDKLAKLRHGLAPVFLGARA